MSYLVLARKYRPANFAQVVGQEHVTRTLANSIKRDKVGHAYLFCGPRGVGKTSIARIFAKSLNCKNGPTADACSECTNCREITEGRSLAVMEIDGASHNSVDNVRDLIDSFRSAPPPGSVYKIYIIDEVHMLSTAAFNALLKSLEEPPSNTVFILATTEVHKIPDTVLSRCQVHNFKALDPRVVRDSLAQIAKSEGLSVEDEVFSMIARLSEGSMRDAQTLLDRVQSYCDGKITAKEASEILSAVDRSLLFDLSLAIFNNQADVSLALIQSAFARGVDASLFLREFVSHWRELLIAAVCGVKQLEELGVSAADQTELLRQVAIQQLTDIQDLLDVAREGCDQALRSAYPKYMLEALVVRMATRANVIDFTNLIGEVRQLVKGTSVSAASVKPKLDAISKANTSSLAANNTGESKVIPFVEKTAGPTKKLVNSETETQSVWREFIGFAINAGASMLTEQLKRLSPVQFEAGKFLMRGPELAASYFKEANNIAKLEVLLNQFKPGVKWQIEIVSSKNAGSAEVGSIVADEQLAKRQRTSKETQAVTNHPSIQNLKKVFPGSMIESIKVKVEENS